MDMNNGASESARTLAVAPMLDVSSALDLLAAVRSALAAPGDLVIDLGGALWMHAAAVQVLAAAVQAGRTGTRSVRIDGISADVALMWGMTGMDAVLIAREASSMTV